MSRCRKLEELVLTGDGHFKFGESSFDQLFEPLQSYLPNNNSNPPPEAQLDEAKQIPFPSLAHFSIFHLMDINSSKLFARLSRLVPLRGLHSLSFENNYPDTPVYVDFCANH
jgi:hypothetical protein